MEAGQVQLANVVEPTGGRVQPGRCYWRSMTVSCCTRLWLVSDGCTCTLLATLLVAVIVFVVVGWSSCWSCVVVVVDVDWCVSRRRRHSFPRTAQGRRGDCEGARVDVFHTGQRQVALRPLAGVGGTGAQEREPQQGSALGPVDLGGALHHGLHVGQDLQVDRVGRVGVVAGAIVEGGEQRNVG